MLKTVLEDIKCFLETSTYTIQTRASYGYVLRRFTAWLCVAGRQDIELIDPPTVGRFLEAQGWGSNLRRLAITALKAFVKWRYGPEHPALALRLPRDDSPPQRTLEAGDVEDLLISFDTTTPLGWRNLCIVGLALETGIRSSEICGLLLDHLDLRHQHFYSRAKGDTWREGVFSHYMAACLDTWITARKSIARPGVRQVFVGVSGIKPGTPLTPGGLRAIFRGIARNAGLPALSPHDLRRTMACMYTESGAPTCTVQLLGGWKTINMVVRYTRAMRPMTRDVERYSPVLNVLGSMKLSS